MLTPCNGSPCTEPSHQHGVSPLGQAVAKARGDIRTEDDMKANIDFLNKKTAEVKSTTTPPDFTEQKVRAGDCVGRFDQNSNTCTKCGMSRADHQDYNETEHSPATRFTEQARQLVKHISDAALELAFVRHALTSDEVIVDDDADVKARVQAEEEFCERIKEDTLACLTGDDTGCLDPEELDESNCELLWTQSLLTRVASEAATQGQVEGIEQAARLCDYYAELERQIESQISVADKESWLRLRHVRDGAGQHAVRIRKLSPDTDFISRIRAEAASAALEQARMACQSLMQCSMLDDANSRDCAELQRTAWASSPMRQNLFCKGCQLRNVFTVLGKDKENSNG